jgi:hypothetical protein
MCQLICFKKYCETSRIGIKYKQRKNDAWSDIAADLQIEKAEVENKMRSAIGQSKEN